MSNIEDRMTKLLDFPYGSYLMLRLEYVLICETELEAKILRLIEMYMENERRKLLQAYLNDQKNNAPKDQVIDITKDVWASISHRLFFYDLYDLVKSENTLKQAIKSLQKKNFIRVKFEQVNRYDAPQYQINTEIVQEEFNKLKQQGKSGYQKLTPSKNDAIKNRPPQDLTPSGYQDLTPSENNSSSDEELRVSKIDPNSRNNNISKIITEENISNVESASADIDATHNPPSPPSKKRGGRKRSEENNTSNETAQPTLIEMPAAPPTMPAEDAPWTAETIVQIVEAKRGKRFEEIVRVVKGKKYRTQRQRQLESAQVIIDAKFTRQQFIDAYDHRLDAWWIEKFGELTVVDMTNDTKTGTMRLIDELEKIAKQVGRKPSYSGNPGLTTKHGQRPEDYEQSELSRNSVERIQQAIAKSQARKEAAKVKEA
jgi:hypothetical protein